MHFSSDNASGVAPEIMEALARANEGPAWAYGRDEITRRLNGLFSDLFEHEVSVFPVSTGTAANALILAALTPPWGAVFCERNAHINVDENGAPEFYSGGAKLVPVDGEHGRIGRQALEMAIDAMPGGDVHHVVPHVLSLTQATEAGTVYGVDDVTALSGLAHETGLKVHMDGARFANAVAHLGCSPADITWKAGIDALSFGATKNGAMAAEAAIFFDPALAAGLEERRMRGGHLLSKMRFLSAQLEAYVADDLWLRLARHANRMATLLADAVTETPGADLLHPVDGDEVFVRFGDVTVIRRLADSGVAFVPWAPREGIIRLVASFQTTEDEVRQFRAALQQAASVAG